jgi:hypothetical protein
VHCVERATVALAIASRGCVAPLASMPSAGAGCARRSSGAETAIALKKMAYDLCVLDVSQN